MKRFRWMLIILMLLVAAVLLATPFVLRAIPSRYVARLPEPIQQLGVTEPQVAILPTVAAPADASLLLGEGTEAETAVSPTAPADVAPPATPTPMPLVDETAVPTPTSSPTVPPTATAVPLPASARLDGFFHQFQTWNNCGPATVAMTLSYFDTWLTQTDTASVLKPNPEDRNVSPHEMAAFVNENTEQQALFRVNGTRDKLRHFLSEGIPVIIEIGIEPPGEFRWLGWYGHYLLVVAYDDAQEQFWVYDSWFGTSETPMANDHFNGRILSYETLEKDWPHFNRNYIAVYNPDQADKVAEIVGDDMNDELMWQGALRRAQADAAADPENPFFWFNLGTVHNAVGNHADAATAFDQARAIGLPWRMLWYQFGPYEAYYEVGRFEDVITLTDVTLKDRPYFEESFYYKGLALAATGDAAAARDNLQRAAGFNPNFEPAAMALAELEG